MFSDMKFTAKNKRPTRTDHRAGLKGLNRQQNIMPLQAYRLLLRLPAQTVADWHHRPAVAADAVHCRP